MGAESRYTQSVAHSHVRVKWTSKALGDVARLYRFLAGVNKQAAVNLRRSAKSVRDYSAKIDQLGYTISRTIANMICAVVNSCSRSPITTDLPRVRPRLMILGNDGLPVADLGGSLGA